LDVLLYLQDCAEPKNPLYACFTSLFWELAKQFFGWYVVNIGRFSLVYGSLSTLIILVLWFYYSSAILILGGEIALLLEKEGNRNRDERK
jgi:membrane protein